MPTPEHYPLLMANLIITIAVEKVKICMPDKLSPQHRFLQQLLYLKNIILTKM